MKIFTTATLVCALILTACASSEEEADVLGQDSRGNYITTSNYRAFERTEFMQAMGEGLEDFDRRLGDLRARANELGGETLQEFARCEDDLSTLRTEFENQLTIAATAMESDWPDEREETVDAYVDLRDALADAFESVLDT